MERESKFGNDYSECKVLLDVCTPLVYVQNAFRISGLAVDASARDIKRRIDDLKHAEELGDAETEHTHAFALKPPPTLEHIREAARKLQDPERRIVEEFFWFWPDQWGYSHTDKALSALVKGDKKAAFKTWFSALSSNDEVSAIVAKHNLAVMYHLVAIDAERYALENDLNPRQLGAIVDATAKYWRTSFKLWKELMINEIFWSIVTNRIRMLNDPRVTTGLSRRMRVTLLQALSKINAMLAVAFFEKGKLELVKRHIMYILRNQAMGDVSEAFTIVKKPLKARIENNIEKARLAAQKEPKKADQSARDLLNAVVESFRIIQMVLPTTDYEYIDLCDSVAETCLICQVAYAQETEDWTTSMQLLDSAKAYAASQEMKTRIEENLVIITLNHYLKFLSEEIAKAEAHITVAEKLYAIQKNVLPILKAMESKMGVTPEIQEHCADLVAQYIRSLSVRAYNENGDLSSSIYILEIAVATARGAETRAQLLNDKAQLVAIREKSIKYNIHIRIRGDDIEITNEFVRLNNQKIAVSQIQGVRFGILHQYTNGIKSGSSYRIDISGDQSNYISIECKRLFRSEDQAQRDFNSILQSILHNVVPFLVWRLVKDVMANRLVKIGNVRLTCNGVYIITGFLWFTHEIFIPWCDLRYEMYQGHLNVSSAKDKSISTTMSLRDTWNAVLFESIVKAIDGLN